MNLIKASYSKFLKKKLHEMTKITVYSSSYIVSLFFIYDNSSHPFNTRIKVQSSKSHHRNKNENQLPTNNIRFEPRPVQIHRVKHEFHLTREGWCIRDQSSRPNHSPPSPRNFSLNSGSPRSKQLQSLPNYSISDGTLPKFGHGEPVVWP